MAASEEFLLREEACPPHPYWPGGNSGVTIGVGWDLGQHAPEELESAWSELGRDVVMSLRGVSGLKGRRAAVGLATLRQATIPRRVAQDVFRRDTLPKVYDLTQVIFPGVVSLPLGAQVALISLVFNRGPSRRMDLRAIVDHRLEMRKLVDNVREKDLFAIYAQLGTMTRLWDGTKLERGMWKRRHHEMKLIYPYLGYVRSGKTGPNSAGQGEGVGLVQWSVSPQLPSWKDDSGQPPRGMGLGAMNWLNDCWEAKVPWSRRCA